MNSSHMFHIITGKRMPGCYSCLTCRAEMRYVFTQGFRHDLALIIWCHSTNDTFQTISATWNSPSCFCYDAGSSIPECRFNLGGVIGHIDLCLRMIFTCWTACLLTLVHRFCAKICTTWCNGLFNETNDIGLSFFFIIDGSERDNGLYLIRYTRVGKRRMDKGILQDTFV